MGNRSAAWAAAALGMLAGVAHAGQTMDGVLLPGEKLRALMDANGETKTLAISGVEGARMTLVCKPYRRSSVQPSLSIRAPDGQVLDLTNAQKVTPKGAVVKNLTLDQTGVWRVTIASPTGGEFQLSTKAKSPLKSVWTGESDGTLAWNEFDMDVLPGSALTLKAAGKGKPKWSPEVEIVDPDGNVVFTDRAEKGPTKVKGLVLDLLGIYKVRLRGGPGSFKIVAKLKPPKGKFREVEFRDVEALPVVTAITPSTVDDDGLREMTFHGFAFSTRQVVTLFDAQQQSYLLGPLQDLRAEGAFARFDFAGVPPGTYTVRISTPLGNRLEVDPSITLTLTNLLPSVVEPTPEELPWDDTVFVQLRGVGFDDDAVVTARRSEDGLEVPVTVTSRQSHTNLNIAMDLPPYKVGPYDITVRDPSGGSRTKTEYVDVFGFKAPPAHLESSIVLDLYPYHAAYSDTDRTAVLAIREAATVRFVLFDPGSQSVLERMPVPSSNAGNHTPRVAWSPADNTWALCWVREGRNSSGEDDQARLMVVSGDFRTVLSDTVLAADIDVSEVYAAANRDAGGFVVAWEQWDGESELRTQPVASDGTLDLADQQIVWGNPDGLIWTPVIAYQGSGRFYIAYLGVTDDGISYAVRRVVVDSQGKRLFGSLTIGYDFDWWNISRLELVANPTDGSLLCGFSWMDQGGVWHPSTIRIEANGTNGDPKNADADGNLPFGLIDSMAWNADRQEFVVAMTGVVGGLEVFVRRIDPDGRMRRAIYLQKYDGLLGALYGGTTSGSLGLALTVDSSPGDPFDASDSRFYIDAGPIR